MGEKYKTKVTFPPFICSSEHKTTGISFEDHAHMVLGAHSFQIF